MPPVLAAALPLFFVVALGFVAARRGAIPQQAVRPLNAFVFGFAMPALIGRTLWAMDVETLFDLRVIAGWLVAGLSLYAATAGLMALGFGGDGGRAAIRGQASVIGNIGFLGIPLSLSLFGDAGAGALAMALMVDLVVIIPLTLAILELRRGAGSAGRAAGRALLRTVGNPFFLSILGGAGLSALAVPMPPAVDRTLAFLGGAASPAALFALGLYLAGNLRIRRPVEAASLSALKLCVHPALVWALLSPGLGVEGATLTAAVLLASLPVASNVFVIAETYDTAPKLAADAVTISTLAGVATVSAALAFL